MINYYLSGCFVIVNLPSWDLLSVKKKVFWETVKGFVSDFFCEREKLPEEILIFQIKFKLFPV